MNYKGYQEYSKYDGYRGYPSYLNRYCQWLGSYGDVDKYMLGDTQPRQFTEGKLTYTVTHRYGGGICGHNGLYDALIY